MFYDSIKPARVLISFIKCFGLWSFRGQTYQPFYKFYGWSLHTVFTFLLILGMYINVTQTDTIDEFADALYMALTETVLLVKVLNILITSQNVVDFLEITEKDTESQPRNGKELRMLQRCQNGFIKLRNVYIGGCVVVVAFSNIGPLIDDDYKLPFPCWIPFDYRNPQNYAYAFSYVALAMAFTALTNMTMDLLQAYLLFQLASFYKLIALRLESYGPPDDVKGFKKIIKVHIFAERMVLRCQAIISVPVFTQVVMSAFILCFTVYQLQKISLLTDAANFITLLMFAVIMAMQIYFPCYYGSEVTISADALTGAVYNSNWVELSAESRKLIFVYMEYLKRPVQVKAGKFFGIGTKVFTKTINNAYSLFALLLNIKD